MPVQTEKAKRVREAFSKLREASELRWNATMPAELPSILVGTGTCGRAAGALLTLETLKTVLHDEGLDARIIEVGCNGHCYAEPLVTISKPGWPPILYGGVRPGVATVLVRNFLAKDDPCLEYVLGSLAPDERVPLLSEFPRSAYEQRILLERCGQIDPGSIDHAIAFGAYRGLARALSISPAAVIQEIKKAGVKGLGGAGYATWKKWHQCRMSEEKERYVICNADEGDPGAFMDRALLEGDPHSIIEGMLIAAWAVGATKGYVYIRSEYPLALETITEAIDQARTYGLLGTHILDTDFSFDVEVIQAPGAFVCGEETALIASIEGERGMPRIRPPYPPEKGVHGKPTIINNVKTLSSVSWILAKGWQYFASFGSKESKGTTVFALAGKVLNTGLVEVPMGTTLRRLIFDIGGGIPNGKDFKAVQIGGPSGGCLPESLLDTPVSFKALNKVGTIMGSGGLVVLDEDNCMVDTALFFLDFIQKESCGKCTFCRIGTTQMLELMRDIVDGRGTKRHLDTLESLAEDIRLGSLCNLGRTAPHPVLSTLRHFRSEYEAHIIEKRCPAKVCRALSAFYIVPERCERTCDACVGSCPTESIFTDTRRVKVIEQATCIKCGACLNACPPQYNAVVKVSPLSEVPDRGEGRAERTLKK